MCGASRVLGNRRRPKHIIEYACLRALAGLLNALPARFAYGCTWAIAWVGHYVVRFRRQGAIRRITEVFGDEFTPAQRKAIAWKSWRGFCYAVTDMVRIGQLTREDVLTSVIGAEALLQRIEEVTREGGGLILAAPHSGSWEHAGVACHVCGAPMFFMAGKQKNPLVDDYLNRMRGVTGIDAVRKDSGPLKQIIRGLREGKVLAIMPDVRSPVPGLPVRFLGGVANLAAGAGMFARQANVPIMPTVVTRERWNRHRWHTGELIRPDPAMEKREDWQRMLQLYIDRVETMIRRYPECYFWYNKRWVLDPIQPPANAAGHS